MSRPAGRPRRSLRHGAAALGLLFGAGPLALAEPQRPAPPRSRVEVYDADALTCRPPVIESAFRSQLAPWADQPPEVQQRLRILQGEMTRSTLRRCLGKGLLSPAEVAELERKLGLPPATEAGPGTGTGSGAGQAQPAGSGTLP